MTNSEMLTEVKKGLGITDNYQDDTLLVYVNEVMTYIEQAGVKNENITSGIVTRGVSDLWNYGSNNGKLSEYFYHRVTQLSYYK